MLALWPGGPAFCLQAITRPLPRLHACAPYAARSLRGPCCTSLLYHSFCPQAIMRQRVPHLRHRPQASLHPTLRAGARRPNFCLQAITRIISSAKLPSELLIRMDENVSRLVQAVSACERIINTPIPLSYTRQVVFQPGR